jgi:acyl carrier protein
MPRYISSPEIIERVEGFVVENFLYARSDIQLTVDDALLERGIIDSMGVVELIAFIEDAFGVEVGDDDVTEQNFGTLAHIATYVMSKQAVTADA